MRGAFPQKIMLTKTEFQATDLEIKGTIIAKIMIKPINFLWNLCSHYWDINGHICDKKTVILFVFYLYIQWWFLCVVLMRKKL